MLVFEKDGFRCVYCGFGGSLFDTWAFLQVDHFNPKSRSGTEDISNLFTSCCFCNHMKLDKEFSSIDEESGKIKTYRSPNERILDYQCGTSRALANSAIVDIES